MRNGIKEIKNTIVKKIKTDQKQIKRNSLINKVQKRKKKEENQNKIQKENRTEENIIIIKKNNITKKKVRIRETQKERQSK